MLVDDLQVVEVLLYLGVIRVDVDVADVNVHLLDGDVVAASQVQLCLHPFYDHLVHTLILGVELVFLIVQSIQQILYVRNL